MAPARGVAQLIAILTLGSTLAVPMAKRSVLNLGDMLSCFDLEPCRYIEYGCYCGPYFLGQAHDGPNKPEPVDAVDSCCQAHDDCYTQAESSKCTSYLADYKYDAKTCECKKHHGWLKPFNQCRDDLCACDYDLAICLIQADAGKKRNIISGCKNN